MSKDYPLSLSNNTVLAGQYIILETIGQGGFGITYKALDRMHGNYVAIKEFFPDTMATRAQGQSEVMPYTGERGENYLYGKKCFLEEAETLAKFIGNENIVRIYSYFEENETAYLVMDFIEGTSLNEYVKQKGGKLSFHEAADILFPVMDALEDVHKKNLVHRDISPDNIIITTEGKAKLIDFGATRQSLGDKSQSLDVVLKHGYAPKEQYSRKSRQGPYTDIYALGATFYFALTGTAPPDSIDRLEEDSLVPLSKLGVELPEEADAAILKAMSVKAGDRYQSMEEFKMAFSTAQKMKAVDAPEETVNAPAEAINPKRIIFYSVAALACIIAGIAIIMLSLSRSNGAKADNAAGELSPTESETEDESEAGLLFAADEAEKDEDEEEGSAEEDKEQDETGSSSEREMLPEIIGNNPNNLLNQSDDYNGNCELLEIDGRDPYCVSTIDGYYYAVDGKTRTAGRCRDGKWEDIDELSMFDDIDILLVSDDYFFTINGNHNVYCVERGSGKIVGNLQIADRRRCTFFRGDFYFISGKTGNQHLYYVPAGLIGTEEAYVDAGTLPADKDWVGVTSDGSGAMYLTGFTENDMTIMCHDFYSDKDDRCSFPFENVLVEFTADGKCFYFSSRDEEKGLVTVSKVDFSNKSNGLARDMAASGKPGSMYGLALCNDGTLSLTVDRKLTRVSFE